MLGLVQGLTEFIPISSKTHLIIIPALFHWKEPPLAFDVILHGGTLLAALAYFRRDLLEILDGIDRPGPSRKVLLLLAIGALPAGLAGALLESRISVLYRRPALAAALLVLTGLILAITETYFRRHPHSESIEDTTFTNVEKISAEVSPGKAAFIGAAQILALSPGISRAGTTIGAGLVARLSRPQAARFSFLISIPLIAGATLAEIPKLAQAHLGTAVILAGLISSFVAGYVAIAGMIGYLQRRGLYPFAAYCFVVGPIVALALTR